MHQAMTNINKLQFFKGKHIHGRAGQEKAKSDLLADLDSEHTRDGEAHGEEENLLEQTLERTLTQQKLVLDQINKQANRHMRSVEGSLRLEQENSSEDASFGDF